MLKVSFYSYKGGAGRSTTSWNTIQRLVKLMGPTVKNPFVIVDTDTESAGSTFLYKADEVFLGDDKFASVQKRMVTNDDTNYKKATDERKEEFFDGMYPIGTFFGLEEMDERAVLLIGANTDRTSNEADVAGKTNDSLRQIENFHKNITKACRLCGAKALFFDTPTGVQFLARKSVEESDIVVCCMRPTLQFRVGTKKQLIAFIKNDIGNDETGSRKYILTPTVICAKKFQITQNGKPYPYPEEAKKRIMKEFGTGFEYEDDKKIEQAFKDNVILDMLEPTQADIKQKVYSELELISSQYVDDDTLVFGIPEIERFKWFEECLGRLPNHELDSSDIVGIIRYEYLAQAIKKYYDELPEEE